MISFIGSYRRSGKQSYLSKKATEFKYSRQISSNDTYRLDIFVDSSLICYAAVAYLNNQLLFTKTRLAPDRTIPELELMAMTLGVKLEEFLQKTLKSVTPKIETFYWSDSLVCIAWSKSQKSLKPFVKNRVSFIQNRKVTFCNTPPIIILQILQQSQIKS